MELGKHAEAIDTLKDDVRSLRADVAEIKELIAAGRGSWRVMVAMGALATTVGGAIASAVAWLTHNTG